MRSIPLEAPQSPPPLFSPFQTPSEYDADVSNEKEATPSSSSSYSSLSRISPLILLVIIVLAVIFFVYGLIHLVLWFLMKSPTSSSLYNSNRFPESNHSRSLQRQLQQLFRLHDSGLGQAVIDALPIFHYQDLLGLKEPFDCAVCLCEFSEQDKLRLLPMCSHAFHMNCLDTWLLSNSTCPLCRVTLSNSAYPLENQNPMLNIDYSCVQPSRFRVTGEEENGCAHRTIEEQVDGKRVFSVRLGTFKNNGLRGGEIGEGAVEDSFDVRRCYSMGSYQYVVPDSNLQLVLSQDEMRRGYISDVSENGNVDGKRIRNRTEGESFSVSKIWLWSKKSKYHTFSSSNAAFP